MHKIKSFIKTYSNAIKDKNAAIFAGAGLSRPAGIVDWKGLLKSITEDLNLDIDKENDLVAITQYHINERAGVRSTVNRLLIEHFTKDVELTENHRILAKLPINTYWTTNYDKLIEKALEDAGKTIDVKITEANLAINIPKRDAIVYKMHGDISQPENAVISKGDYELYELNRKLYTTALKGDLVSKTFLFIGFSFDDPNLSYILSRIRILLDKNQREHYCFFRKINEKDYKCREDYEYANIKQQYKINDLKNYSITGILINDYSEITHILKNIEDRFKRNSIFISGSASGYGDWGEDRCLEFIYYLGEALAKKEYKIVSGYGLGIGSQIINGALQYIFSSKYRHIDDYLVLRPFPIHITDKSKKKEIWHQYREDIIKQAGIAIIILGNKKDDNGNIIEADGVYREFEIAVENGLKILPIGATGFVAEKLWHEINNNYKSYFSENIKLRELFNKLNDKDLELPILIGNIMQMVEILKDEN